MRGDMVVATLEDRKTETRRLIKPQPEHRPVLADNGNWYDADGIHAGHLLRCPYGRPGDRLWIKETWRTEERASDGRDGIRYRADDKFVGIANTREAADDWVRDHDNGKHGQRWRPSIFMRRWASRILLEIVAIRAERLCLMKDKDARAEGCLHVRTPVFGHPTYEHVWNSINPEHRFLSNPYVWVIQFKRIKP